MPRARSMSAVVRPPIPPPTMIAFMGPNSTQPRMQPEAQASHGPLFGCKRLCRFGLEFGPGLRLSLNSEVFEIRPAERHEIGTAGGQDGVDLIGSRDVADAHRGDPGFVAHLVGKRRLEHA